MEQNPKLAELLVKRLLKKHGIEKSNVKLSDEEKSELKEVIDSIKGQVEEFLDNMNESGDETEENSSSDEK
ncbi:hypothetical protein [Alteribacillus iranensis]|uniref:Spore coat protein W n=1 Tax=Alteribacillus iranensis TaxID=930128 RepID=A0A1I2DLZ7_9BACI|nr:hypothetical protein [Alteribacillus iranensis]SFE81477.1 hypothetical protein SAMN05192532_104156 [Alteribacillus iranensis]